jgi:hypothetical protein
MSNAVKDKIYKMLDSIKDEQVLTQVMEDVAFYSSRKDAVDYLNEDQLKQLDEAIKEVNRGETISLNDFKKALGEWKEKL